MRIQVGRSHRLVEVTAILSCLAVTIALIVPGNSFVGEQSRRRVCMSNLRRLGQACHIYAQDDPGVFPAISVITGLPPSTANDGEMGLFDPTVRTIEPSTTGIPSPTVDMWALIRADLATPRHFICPSTPDTPDPAQDASAYFDFLSPDNLSYGYQYQHDPNRAIIGRDSEPTFPVMADGNPYIKGGVAKGTLTADRDSTGRGNSTNHPIRQGQNVLFQAGHVFFLRSPDAGLPGLTLGLRSSRGRDNIYSVASELADVDPGNNAPIAFQIEGGGFVGVCDLGSRSDACLVP